MRTYIPGVCCAHTDPVRYPWLRCARCGATCVRDRDGRIVELDATKPVVRS